MNEATINLLKILFLTTALLLLVIKMLRVIRYNQQSDEPIPQQLFFRYSATEIDGSYSTDRKRTLYGCNRITYLAYLCLALAAILSLLPTIAERLGLLA
jgi:hypothetical protein